MNLEQRAWTMPAETVDKTAPVVSVRNLTKHFGRLDGTVVYAIDGVSMDVFPGEFVVLLGPSGCGKTTLLRTIAGLERPDRGEIDILGRTCFSSDRNIHVPVEKRRISMIFQSYALWPHMTIFQNVAYPLRTTKPRKSHEEILTLVDEALRMANVRELAKQYPGQISGGQQQRVALARALVVKSDVVLFDEPLSNVDAKVRDQLRAEMVAMQREIGFAGIYVTHDQNEAMGLADEIIVLKDGRLEQRGTPSDVYNAPKSRYVANFVGRTNESTGRIVGMDGPLCIVETGLGMVRGTPGSPGFEVGDNVIVAWRPEKGELRDGADGGDEMNVCAGNVVSELFLGTHWEVTVETSIGLQTVWRLGRSNFGIGDNVSLAVRRADTNVLPSQ